MWMRSRYMFRVNFGSLLDVTIDDGLSWSHHLLDVKMNFVHKLNPLKRRRNALLDLYFKIILYYHQFYMDWSLGAAALLLTFNILWKYLTLGQPEYYTTCPEICLLRKYSDIRTGILNALL